MHYLLITDILKVLIMARAEFPLRGAGALKLCIRPSVWPCISWNYIKPLTKTSLCG